MSRNVYTFAVLKRYCGTKMPPHKVAFVVSARHVGKTPLGLYSVG